MAKRWQPGAPVQSFIPDEDWVRQVLPARPLDAHKGTFGTALVVAGSVNYTGAAWLAGQAAYRIGAGLVTLAVPAPLHAALAGQFPEATWLLLPHKNGVIAADASQTVLENLGRATAMLVGPGFGLAQTSADFLEGLAGRDRSNTSRPSANPPNRMPNRCRLNCRRSSSTRMA